MIYSAYGIIIRGIHNAKKRSVIHQNNCRSRQRPLLE